MKHKKILRKSIKMIMFSLIWTIILVYILGILILKNYEHQVKSIADQTIEFYGHDMDEEMENINHQLVNTLINNKIIKQLSQLDKQKSENDVVVQSIAKQNELITYFDSLNINYGNNYHFWYFNTKQDTFVTSGDGDYANKELFKKEIRRLSTEDEIPISQKGQWFLLEINQKLYLTTVFHLNSDYLGCFISPERLLSSLWNVEDNPDSTIILIDKLTKNAYSASLESKNKGFVRCEEKDYKDSYICKYTFECANVDMEMAVYQSLQRKASYFQFAMFITAGLIIALCIGTLAYSRYAISTPLQRFSINLKNYIKTGEFKQQDYYEEFEGVGDILNNLEQEIKQLKVSVYEEKLEKQKAQIEYLQMQIRPHFYINCLNSIFSMSQLGHDKEIQELVRYVSSYMRSIFRKGMNPVALKEELDNIENYIRIHKILYRYCCTYQIDVNPEILSAEIPPLLVMIFVENCIKYTSGMKKDVSIRIQADYEDEEKRRIYVNISDSGPGFSEEMLEMMLHDEIKKKDDRFQIGISNAKNRLQMLYGSDAELIMKNGEMGGAEVKILIPFQCVKE